MIALRRAFLIASCFAFASAAVAQERPAQPAPQQEQPQDKTSDDAIARLIDDLVTANHILADQGVLDGYGHVSVRSPRDPSHFYMSRSMAPELVTAKDILEYDLSAEPVSAKGERLFIERFMHSEIYRARPDVIAVAHNHAPPLIPFGVTGVELKPLYHMSAFLSGGVPIFDIRSAAGGDTDMLVRNPMLGKALAKTLGSRPVALLRGHGAVVVGTSLPQVVFRSVYTEQNARLQAQAMQLGKNVKFLDPQEAKKAETSLGGTIGRPWELWKRKAMADSQK